MADAPNFDRGHSLTLLLPPLAAFGSLPTASDIGHWLAMTHCKPVQWDEKTFFDTPKSRRDNGGFWARTLFMIELFDLILGLTADVDAQAFIELGILL